jgi:ribosomal protein S18 acetylase RimI-like enzyme
MADITIREATSGDLQQAKELIVRLKRLTGEFDPVFRVSDNVLEQASEYFANSLNSKDTIMLVAVTGKRVIGILRAELTKRLFYEPSLEGLITDFYILPEARRKALGKEMVQGASRRLKDRGAQIIIARFTSQNEIASKFYVKRGFRPLLNYYVREEGV